jgi:hypothetical protein
MEKEKKKISFKMTSRTILLVVFCSTGQLLFGQSEFLPSGQSGIQASAGFLSNSEASGFYGGLGYSFSGNFDIGFSVGRYGYDNSFYDENLSAIALSPYFNFLPVKQSGQIPVSISLGAAFERSTFSSDILDLADLDMTGDYFSFGSSLFTNITVSEAMIIQPGLGVTYITGVTKLKNPNESISETNNATLFSLRTSLIFNNSERNSFVMSPSVSFSEDLTSFGLSLSYIIQHR